jgi:hypothetical protein
MAQISAEEGSRLTGESLKTQRLKGADKNGSAYRIRVLHCFSSSPPQAGSDAVAPFVKVRDSLFSRGRRLLGRPGRAVAFATMSLHNRRNISEGTKSVKCKLFASIF